LTNSRVTIRHSSFKTVSVAALSKEIAFEEEERIVADETTRK
jgi:hypothetical protein